MDTQHKPRQKIIENGATFVIVAAILVLLSKAIDLDILELFVNVILLAIGPKNASLNPNGAAKNIHTIVNFTEGVFFAVAALFAYKERAVIVPKIKNLIWPVFYFYIRASLALALIYVTAIFSLFAADDPHVDTGHFIMVLYEVWAVIVFVIIILPSYIAGRKIPDNVERKQRWLLEAAMMVPVLCFMALVGYTNLKSGMAINQRHKKQQNLLLQNPPLNPPYSPPVAVPAPPENSGPVTFLIPSATSIPPDFKLVQSNFYNTVGYNLGYMQDPASPHSRANLHINEKIRSSCEPQGPGQIQKFVFNGIEGKVLVSPQTGEPGIVSDYLFWNDKGNCLTIFWLYSDQVKPEDVIKILNTLVRSDKPPADKP